MAANAQMPSVMAVMNLATLHRTVPTRFLPQEHHTTKADLIQCINIPTPKGTNHTPPIMVPDMGDIFTGHIHTTVPTMREAAVSEDTPHTSNAATTPVCTAIWPIDALSPL